MAVIVMLEVTSKIGLSDAIQAKEMGGPRESRPILA